jgi:hypothetical protein
LLDIDLREGRMTHPEAGWEDRDEVRRVADEARERLRARGVTPESADSPEDLATLLEAVEDFEMAVESRGGDLFVVEPVEGKPPQPNDPRFVLPARHAGERAKEYLSRLTAVTTSIRFSTTD